MAVGDGFKIELPESRWIGRELDGLGKRIKTKVLKSSLRAAAGVYRTALRSAARKYKDSGDAAKAVFVSVKRGASGTYYALAGFRYGKFGKPPKSSQDPGVYTFFLEEGAKRDKRGKVRGTNFASREVEKKQHAQAAMNAFAIKFRQQLSKLKSS